MKTVLKVIAGLFVYEYAVKPAIQQLVPSLHPLNLPASLKPQADVVQFAPRTAPVAGWR